jgi:hypothetical protein
LKNLVWVRAQASENCHPNSLRSSRLLFFSTHCGGRIRLSSRRTWIIDRFDHDAVRITTEHAPRRPGKRFLSYISADRSQQGGVRLQVDITHRGIGSRTVTGSAPVFSGRPGRGRRSGNGG